MRRRAFITLLGGAVVWPVVTHAQQGERVRLIGILNILGKDDPEAQAKKACFGSRLRKNCPLRIAHDKLPAIYPYRYYAADGGLISYGPNTHEPIRRAAIENVRLFESVEARTRELANSLENLRTTQDRLVQTQKLASLGQLTAGIAHEIKNPLNFVNNFSGVSAELRLFCFGFRSLPKGLVRPLRLDLLTHLSTADPVEHEQADLSSRSADRICQFTRDPRRASSPLRPDLGFRYTRANCGVCSRPASLSQHPRNKSGVCYPRAQGVVK